MIYKNLSHINKHIFSFETMFQYVFIVFIYRYVAMKRARIMYTVSNFTKICAYFDK